MEWQFQDGGTGELSFQQSYSKVYELGRPCLTVPRFLEYSDSQTLQTRRDGRRGMVKLEDHRASLREDHVFLGLPADERLGTKKWSRQL